MKKSTTITSLTMILTAALCSTLAVRPALADLHQITSDDLIIGTEIGTRFRIYVQVNAGDHVDELFGTAVEPIILSPVIGAAIFQLLELQSWPKEVRAALLGNSTSTVPLTNARVTDGSPFAIPIGSDNRGPSGTPRTQRGTFLSLPPGRGDILASGLPLRNLRTFPDRATSASVIIPAPGALGLLSLAGFTYRRRRK